MVKAMPQAPAAPDPILHDEMVALFGRTRLRAHSV